MRQKEWIYTSIILVQRPAQIDFFILLHLNGAEKQPAFFALILLQHHHGAQKNSATHLFFNLRMMTSVFL